MAGTAARVTGLVVLQMRLVLLHDAENHHGRGVQMPTKIPANRTAGSVKCRPSSARRRERRLRRPCALRVGVVRTGVIGGSRPSPGAVDSYCTGTEGKAHH